MFVSDQLVYLELHKTGCTHIRNLLDGLLRGSFTGKHDQITRELLDSDRAKLGSVRDPWSWYLSLWAYGCDGQGGVYHRVTNTGKVIIKGLGWKKTPWDALRRLAADMQPPKNARQWKRMYRDINDAGAFREWLHMMHDARYTADFGYGYHGTPISEVAGLLSFRYLNLFCRVAGETDRFDQPLSPSELVTNADSSCFIDSFIRNENLEADLIAALEAADIRLTDDDRTKILSAGKTNTSSRRQKMLDFYDADTDELIRQRERLIVERFGYTAPSAEA